MLVALAILLRGTTLVKLLDRKFELLIQLVPVFMIAIHWTRMRREAVFVGMAVGVAVCVIAPICGYDRIFGIHPGIYGLGLNLLISVGGSVVLGSREGEAAKN